MILRKWGEKKCENEAKNMRKRNKKNRNNDETLTNKCEKTWAKKENEKLRIIDREKIKFGYKMRK